MIPYNTGECRKHVMQQLRNTSIFAVRAITSLDSTSCARLFSPPVAPAQRDAENEGCWTLGRDDETDSSEIKYYEPQIGNANSSPFRAVA
jgi:hypothetical protein